MPQKRLLFVSLILFIGLSLFFTSVARAQFFSGPIALSMGGAGRGAADPSESAFLNPASISQFQSYNFSAFYGFANRPELSAQNTFAGMITDSSEDKYFPGALSGVSRFSEPTPIASGGTPSAYTEQDIQFAGSLFVRKQLSVGLALHHQIYSPGVGNGGNQDNFTLGTLWVPWQNLGIGLVAYDLYPSVLAAPIPIRQTPTYALGANYILQELISFRADLVRPTEGPRNGRTDLELGVQAQVRNQFSFRAGTAFRETLDQTLMTLGFAFQGPRLRVEYAFQKDVRVAQGATHMIDLWLPL